MTMSRFRPDMLVVEALEAHPGAAEVFVRLGYRCIDPARNDWCVVIEKDTLAEAARLHEKPVGELLGALNALPALPKGGTAEGCG